MDSGLIGLVLLAVWSWWFLHNRYKTRLRRAREAAIGEMMGHISSNKVVVFGDFGSDGHASTFTEKLLETLKTCSIKHTTIHAGPDRVLNEAFKEERELPTLAIDGEIWCGETDISRQFKTDRIWVHLENAGVAFDREKAADVGP